MRTMAQRKSGGRPARRKLALRTIVPLPFLLILCVAAGEARAVTPQSPEVRKLVDESLAYLNNPITDGNGIKLGGRCLVGLAYLKAGRRDHPHIAEAVKACRDMMTRETNYIDFDMYSNGLAIIFLCEASEKDYAREIQWYLNQLKLRQKEHGGWGYANSETGDTSQTQYGALSYWEALRHGFRIDGGSVEGVADWIMRTQSPQGHWGYQGIAAPPGERVDQVPESCSMQAAGLGIAYICADLLGASSSSAAISAPAEDQRAPLPASLRRLDEQQRPGDAQRIRPQRTNLGKLMGAIDEGQKWFTQHYKIDNGDYNYYYLYALERFRSFQEAFDGAWNDEPQWYNDGYEFLLKTKKPQGYWNAGCGPACDTAFAILFLLRSTQQSLRGGLGEGALVSGRGLPMNLSKAKLVDGQLVIEQVHAKVNELLTMIDADDNAALDDLARDPSQLVVENVDAQSGRRLQQLARGGDPDVRLLSIRARPKRKR